MKKTACIQLVLITAALAACNRPMYQQEYYSPAYYPGDLPDSTNSCPIDYSPFPPDYYNWWYGFRPYGTVYVDPYVNVYYRHRHRETVRRSGFGGKISAVSS
ncbi:MAG TPA: hypothetical protein VKQ52_11665 [Puia sp.]|nr:hypothetical protein [Puia sp.]